MTQNRSPKSGCSEKYAELCAISTTGELSDEEWLELINHIKICEPCRLLQLEFERFIHREIPKLAPEFTLAPEGSGNFDDKRLEQLLQAYELKGPSLSVPQELRSAESNSDITRGSKPRRVYWALASAAALIACTGISFELGRSTQLVPSQSQTPLAVSANRSSNTEIADLRVRLEESRARELNLQTQISLDQDRLAAVSQTRTTLLAQIDKLTESEADNAGSLNSIKQEREVLQVQLEGAKKLLAQNKEGSEEIQRERDIAVTNISHLEQEVAQLKLSLVAVEASESADHKFLAEDRDIRDLMGARDLYIADVFDVEHDGKRNPTFGRVFYTKGKSLIFYAFDLQNKAGYLEAKAFQVWGTHDSSSDKAISLGMFYMDQEQNRRWVLKSEDPEVIARINSVFVTVEPPGGSHRPTGKPFLVAYLHSLSPNHP